MYKKGRVNSNSRIISTDEDPSLRIESSAIINLRGVSTKLNKYKYHICDKSATTWHHVQIHKKATFLQHIGNRWLRGICSPATGAKIYAKLFICLYAKMAKMSDFSNHNVFAYMLASCANLNFYPVYIIWVSVTCVTLFVNCKSLKLH